MNTPYYIIHIIFPLHACIIQEDESCQINGIKMVGEMSGAGLEQAKCMERRYAKLMASTLQVQYH